MMQLSGWAIVARSLVAAQAMLPHKSDDDSPARKLRRPGFLHALQDYHGRDRSGAD